MRFAHILAACSAWIGCTTAAHGVVLVHFQPTAIQVAPGASFTIDLLADFSHPVTAWGLDANFDPAHLAASDPAMVGPAWLSAFAPDGDGLLGVAFPDSVGGDSVVLATLSFTALLPGETSLGASTTPGDLNEGFALDPLGFDTFTVQPASITVLPEPTALVGLMVVGAGGLALRRGRAAATREGT